MPDWSTQLKTHGLRATAAAQAVLAELHTAPTTLSHDELLTRITGRLGDRTPDRVTVYRVLERLIDVGLVSSLATIGRARRFSVMKRDTQAQFECNRCHRITAMTSDPQLQKAVAVIHQRLQQMGMTALHPAIATHGLCADCAGSA
ncbi:MAG: transcriptional repressor [Natronospirillum sp.]